MAPVIDELMAALWDHLRPNPYSHFHAHTTMRILGKLGGRNRKFLSRPPELEYKPYADDESSIDIRVVGSAKERPFPARLGIDLAMSKLMEVPKAPAAKKSDGFHKQQALKLISTQIKLIIGSDNLPDDFAQLVRLQANDLADREFTVGTDLMTVSEREKSIPKKDADQESLKKLLKACMFAASLPDTKASASALLQDVYRHFTILEVGRALAYEKHRKKDFDVKAGEGPVCIDSSILADAMIETLSSDNAAVRDVAIEAVTAIRDAAVVVFGASDRIDKLPFFSHLAKTFSHSCHEEDWFVKAGGTLGIDVMANKIDMGDEWMILHQIDFIRALMYVMKDVPQDLPANTRIQAQYTLEILLRRCHSK
ncbi:transcription-associated protein 1, partial [Cryomyces antarcticus]